MKFLFVMDPPGTMLPDKDTTFALMRASKERGHSCYSCLPSDLFAVGKELRAMGRLTSVSDAAPHVTLGSVEELELGVLSAIFVRKDPPFDVEYLHLTQLLDLVKAQTFVCNDPAGLRNANEKLFALQFQDWMPKTMVTKDRAAILQFVKEVGGASVLKPLDGAGGSGVVALRTEDKNARALTDILTHEGKQWAMVQEFQPGISEGDKRVLMLNGKPLGAILRVPRPDDIRANIHVGGSVFATELTTHEQALCAALGPELVKHGLYFVGLDLIGGKLIEINVTSPTGIQELGRLTGSKPERDVIAWVESQAKP
jgi:glutathione synthase